VYLDETTNSFMVGTIRSKKRGLLVLRMGGETRSESDES